MPNHTQIYLLEAQRYEELIAKQPLLGEKLHELYPFSGKDVLDLGAGTGRLTVPVAQKANSILALDASAAKLEVTAKKLEDLGLSNWRTEVADHRQLPVEANSMDLVVSGWSIAYLASTNQKNWSEDLKQVISEIKRVLKPGGACVIFETLGTGWTTPHPPDFLTSYYTLLEQEYGFEKQWIRTDYTFNHIEEAVELTRFFFGDALAQRVRDENLVILPECAGIWTLKLPSS
ncbi:class I SAM-dependent methyltransferase [Bacillus horti]|uniref:Ubiquinone/menaquinone biosynthesis C-methylase UbiE n=1 Tax=Caldalkalibacillus horti TaxID=77523 RepID=A0ABT9W4W9_9BACI|nr:class I SAM-dependent methyltransferase [Bacillus horti]MDQ0167895.1 ubiquinone/menaquinone biosynthesis C-methylase UbiE [Bacillus horti]